MTSAWALPSRLAACGETPRAVSLGLFAEGFVAKTCGTPGTAAFWLRALDENSGARRHDGFHHRLLELALSGPQHHADKLVEDRRGASRGVEIKAGRRADQERGSGQLVDAVAHRGGLVVRLPAARHSFDTRPAHAHHTKVRVGKFPTGLFVLSWPGSASATPIWGPKAARQARRSRQVLHIRAFCP